MTESTNKKIWVSMQQRIERIQKRQTLIPIAKKLQKELLIIKMQMEKMEEKPLDNLYDGKRSELSMKSDELNQLQLAYSKLVEEEMDVLKNNLETIMIKIADSVVYDLDLEDHRSSLEQSLSALYDEMNQVLRSKSKGGFQGKTDPGAMNYKAFDDND